MTESMNEENLNVIKCMDIDDCLSKIKNYADKSSSSKKENKVS